MVQRPAGVKLKGVCVCVLLITAAEREEVCEVQEVVAWTAPLCLAAESGSSEPQRGQTSGVNPLAAHMWIYAEGHI